MSEQNDKLILASHSSRRAQLLKEHGYLYEVVIPAVVEPEPRSKETPPAHWAEALSYFKARSVAKDLSGGYILAADTVVVFQDHMFGQPADRDDARRILETLSGTEHEVITGVTLLRADTYERLIRHDVTQVTMRKLRDEVMDAYLESDLWRGKAGAYGIQDGADANIERINGSYSNVVGLPMELVERMCQDMCILDDVRPSKKRKKRKAKS